MAIAMPLPPNVFAYEPLGAARDLFGRRDDEVLLAGPAGTGKSRGCLEKVYLCALKYPKLRALIVRKTRRSLTESAIATFEHKVIPPGSDVRLHHESQQYRGFPGGAVVAVGGLDDAQKIMSSDWDLIYVQEATELTEHDWETLTTRLRNGAMPYQQLLADCNPSAPSHWLKKRADAGKTRLLESRHEDNPTLWDRLADTWTAFGTAYIAKLDALTGVRRLRLRKGIWAAAEGMVYDGWDPALHLVDRFDIPREWPRYWAIDFGYTNPFCWQAWAQDPDGRLYRYREIYRTQTLVEDHAAEVLTLTRDEPKPIAVICDHDAEDRATFERHAKVSTLAAHKSISPGVQAMATRLKAAGDGRPRLFYLRDSLHRPDSLLAEAKKPMCTEEEIEGYVWPTPKAVHRPADEVPVDKDNHGCDGSRYMVAHVDLIGRVQRAPSIYR